MSSSNTPPRRKTFSQALYALFSSFGLATVLLVLLFLITLFGTLEQVQHGLLASQRKYFESWIITSLDFGSVKLPFLMPGGFLVMLLLFINMVVGAVIRVKKRKSGIGVLIAHISILFLLFAGFVEFFTKKEGSLALTEGQTSNEFQSYHDSVIEIEKIVADGEKRQAWVIPSTHFQDLTQGRGRRFVQESLPFTIQLSNYEVNAEPRRVKDSNRLLQADGYFIQSLKRVPEAEMNLDAIYVDIHPKDGSPKQRGILWRAALAPWTLTIGKDQYNFNLTRRVFPMNFAVRLEKFEREVHPGTERARRFTSEVTKLVDGREEKKIITMNSPLRDSGLVLFQASFSQERSMAGGVKNRSVFAVVENPSDNWPLYSTIAVSIGMIIHMAGQLSRFLSRNSAKKS